ncbi:unnamed protein product [Ranitomeya imitator]|uniref:Reverse transcriptase domain-containing protein n=1 Tax=Ranitomeya imitator TaxID=111125 RepID=A0ABN9LN21_9NEOB|nr:unnamed protein product [Ranitomeya imitator]
MFTHPFDSPQEPITTIQPSRAYTQEIVQIVDIKETIRDQRLGFLPVRHNLTPLEKQALTSLKDNNHIVIKPADKGGATVVMNKNQYIAEIKRQLADTTTYRKIQADPVYNIRRKIATILTKHTQLQTIDAKTKTFLTNDHPVTPVLYILPKIHKNLLNPPGRPIVASTDSILNPISIYLEKLLTPYTHQTKSFILDTSDFLKRIQDINTIPANSILCTLDVNSLYTSITHDTGIKAVSLTLSEAGVDTRSQDLCLELLNLVLRENYFLFEDDFYVQICGTAMGSNVAPAYANLYMDRFEREFVYPDTLFQQHAILWYRYIDDIFCIWQGDHTSLTTFYNTINKIRTELKFSISHHMEAITFLDTKVCKDVQGSLTTDIYTKATDRNNLLLYNSCHPKSTRNSLPRSQFKRVSRIVSNPTIRQARLQEMSKKFEDRAYPCTLLNTEMTKALSEMDPTSIPLPTPPRLPFVHSHHPSMQRVHNLIHKQWPLLTKAYPRITFFKNPPLMCLRRPPNIKDRLRRCDQGYVLAETSKLTSRFILHPPIINFHLRTYLRFKKPFLGQRNIPGKTASSAMWRMPAKMAADAGPKKNSYNRLTSALNGQKIPEVLPTSLGQRKKKYGPTCGTGFSH